VGIQGGIESRTTIFGIGLGCLNRDLFLSYALYVTLCVSLFSGLFWVSSLACPHLLGTKGYVVVVVVFLIPHLIPHFSARPVIY
jgi:hypothetical protein